MKGWLRKHVIKFQTIEFPDGISGPAYGPSSGRHNDLWSLRESEILSALDLVQRNPETADGIPDLEQYMLYGDGIYNNDLHLKSKHTGPNLSQRKKNENIGKAAARESIEWSYVEIKQMFPFLSEKEKLKLENMPVGDIYFTALLLRNCLNCLYGSKTSDYFGVEPPTLEEYMNL